MNQLAAAKTALKRRGPKKLYEFEFEKTETFSIRIEAADEDEAREMGEKEIASGNGSSTGSPNIAEVNWKEIS